MRRAGFSLPVLALALTACGSTETEAPESAAQRGIERSVADIQAAEAAVQAPVTVSRSVGELTGKASAAPKDAAAKGSAPAEG